MVLNKMTRDLSDRTTIGPGTANISIGSEREEGLRYFDGNILNDCFRCKSNLQFFVYSKSSFAMEPSEVKRNEEVI
jgi:hypothetical protein